MSQIKQIIGQGVPVIGNDIDTDRIIPARFFYAVLPLMDWENKLSLMTESKSQGNILLICPNIKTLIS